MNREKAIQWINEYGFVLVYPQKSKSAKKSAQKSPAPVVSLWDLYFPKIKMKWSWDEDADNRVGKLWVLRAELCQDTRVVYSKAFQNRAAFFSKKMFSSFLSLRLKDGKPLSGAAKQILEALEIDSPLSTKQLKVTTELRGKLFEAEFARATKQLWQRGLIVGMGEIDDGAFPSLAYGATQTVHEDLYQEAVKKPQPREFEKLPELVQKGLKIK